MQYSYVSVYLSMAVICSEAMQYQESLSLLQVAVSNYICVCICTFSTVCLYVCVYCIAPQHFTDVHLNIEWSLHIH